MHNGGGVSAGNDDISAFDSCIDIASVKLGFFVQIRWLAMSFVGALVYCCVCCSQVNTVFGQTVGPDDMRRRQNCRLHVTDDWQRLIVDEDSIRAVFGSRLGFGDDHDDRMTAEQHHVVCQHGTPAGIDRAVFGGQISRSENCNDARHSHGCTFIDAGDFCVGVGAQDRAAVEHTRQTHVARILCRTRELLGPIDDLVAFAEGLVLFFGSHGFLSDLDNSWGRIAGFGNGSADIHKQQQH